MAFSRRSFLLIGLAPLAGCAWRPLPAPEVHPSLVSHHLLDSGDEIRVVVYGQAELSSTHIVDKAGYVSLPLIGAVEARGRTTQLLEGDIAGKLKESYLRDPDVSIEVVRYRPFFIMGEVVAGGQYTYVPGLTVQSAVAVAGGFTPRAYRAGAEVTRQINGEVATARLAMTDPILAGDTINIRARLI